MFTYNSYVFLQTKQFTSLKTSSVQFELIPYSSVQFTHSFGVKPNFAHPFDYPILAPMILKNLEDRRILTQLYLQSRSRICKRGGILPTKHTGMTEMSDGNASTFQHNHREST